jgi:hypothetical protein
MRGYATLLGGTGGVGKTATSIGLSLAYMTGRRDILDMHVFQNGRVWINVLEDDLDELDRRIHAAMIAHNVSRADIEGKLFVNTADQRPILLARENPDDHGFDVCADAEQLEAGIKEMGIGLTIIDPLVKAHRVVENSNEHMDQLISLCNGVARRTNTALLINTHFRKGGADGGNRDAFRGGSSLIDGGRIARSMAPMTGHEASAYNIKPEEAFRYVKIIDAKANMAPKDRASWLRLNSVEIGNREVHPAYKAGDNVQVAVAWKPPPLYEGLDRDALTRIFDAFRSGPVDAPGWFYSIRQRAKYPAGNVIMTEAAKSRDEATKILADWKDSGLITEEQCKNPNRDDAWRIRLNEDKIAEMMSFVSISPDGGT